jgi:hypothetical protein
VKNVGRESKGEQRRDVRRKSKERVEAERWESGVKNERKMKT